MDVKDSINWYREKVKTIRSINVNRVFTDSPGYRLRSNIGQDMIGQLYLFQYDAKWKDKLPYYDQAPLIFFLEVQDDNHFLALNLHYISPFRRAQLLNALYDYAILDDKNRVQKLAISYGILKGATKTAFFKPCVKSYLIDHLRSRFLKILPSEWAPVTLLPLARFVGATEAKVHYDSNAKIRGEY